MIVSIMSSIAESTRDEAWKPRWWRSRFVISSSSETPETDWRRLSRAVVSATAFEALRCASCESEPIVVMSEV